LPHSDAVTYRFEDFELDPARFELRKGSEPVPIEPQVLSLLLLLASNPDRLISKDEIVEKIWNGRFISDSAISARIKSARQALGDDGKQQRLLRTVHGRGLRFVGQVEFVRPPPSALALETTADGPPADHREGRPSIAVLPFRLGGGGSGQSFVADALADELIADLARLRWLFVIARGSTFRFRSPEVDCRVVGTALGVRYCLTGSVTLAGDAVTVAVELVETGTGGVIWAESYTNAFTSVRELLHEIAANVVAALEVRIPLNEAQGVRSHPAGELDAWSAYHVGLQHVLRFNRSDNQLATRMFEQALQRDPEFARAYAGLSFASFQNAFLNYEPDRLAQAEAARVLAEKALQRDPLDPFCHFNMGRSMWLRGDMQDCLTWLDRATTLSPNYAQGIYSRAVASTLWGDADAGERDARLALQLSPLDPLRYAMLATLSLSHITRGDHAEAAILGDRAARSPGAHKHIALIAAIATSLAGRTEDSARWVAAARQADPHLTAADFLTSFPFGHTDARETIERSLAHLGL
jgi:TolB-like protein/Tfp pilus assembly protein PilF